MSGPGKRLKAAMRQVDRDRQYTPVEAIRVLNGLPSAKFDETVELAFRLGVDPRKADQMIRGTVSLPHGTGRSVRVAAFATGDKAREAQEAGADIIGGEDLVNDVMKGNIEFDAAVATPDVMSLVGRAGRVLGPRGLMPNPKAGTVTFDIGKAVRDIKAGKLEYRVDRQGNLHLVVGKRSFDEERLLENYLAIVDEVLRAKPAAAKGRYIKTVTLSSTMGPGIKIDPNRVRETLADTGAAAAQAGRRRGGNPVQSSSSPSAVEVELVERRESADEGSSRAFTAFAVITAAPSSGPPRRSVTSQSPAGSTERRRFIHGERPTVGFASATPSEVAGSAIACPAVVGGSVTATPSVTWANA